MHFTFASLCTQLLAVLGLAVMDVDMTVDLAAGPGPGSAATAGTAHSKAARPKGRLPHQVR